MTMDDSKWGYVTAIVCLAAALVACLVWHDAAVVAHAAINVFATGRTGVKTIIFLAYAIVVLALFVASGSRKPSSTIAAYRAKIAATVGIIGAYALNLGLYLSFMLQYGFPLKAYSLIYNNGQMTSMQFLHNHISKGAIALFTYGLHILPTGASDDGRTLIGMLPSAWFALLACLIALAIAALTACLVSQAPRLRNEGAGKRWAYLALFTLSSFMVMKSMIDGGPLSFEAVVGSAFLILLLGDGSKRSKTIAASLLSSYIVVCAALYIGGYFASDAAYGYLSFSTMTVTLMLVSAYSFYRSDKMRLNVLVAVLAAVCFAGQMYNGLGILPYLHATIPARDGAYVTSYRSLSSDGFSLIGMAGLLGVYRFTTPIDRNMSDIVRMTGVTSNPDPVAVPWRTCIPTGPDEEFSFTLWSKSPLSALSEKTALYSFEAKPRPSSPGVLYDATVRVPQCYAGVATLLVDGILSQYSPQFAYFDIVSSNNDIQSAPSDN